MGPYLRSGTIGAGGRFLQPDFCRAGDASSFRGWLYVTITAARHTPARLEVFDEQAILWGIAGAISLVFLIAVIEQGAWPASYGAMCQPLKNRYLSIHRWNGGGYDEQDAYSDYAECMTDEAVKPVFPRKL
jgi:hypothetical protein